MFNFRSPRTSIFDTFDFGLDSSDPHFIDFFEQSFLNGHSQDNKTYRKTKLQKALSKVQSQEISINRQIKHYESSIDSLKKAKEEIDKYKEELQKEIDAIQTNEEKKRVGGQQSSSSNNNPFDTTEKRVFKKFFYKTPEVEIEEQYDSTDPKNCFKVIRKEGQPPQILNSKETSNPTIPALDKEPNESPSRDCCSHKKPTELNQQ